MEDKIVAIVNIHTEYVEEIDRWTGRIRVLGITSYRTTKTEAVQIAKEMFSERIQVHRELGNLESWLNTFDLEWSWESEYTGALPVEDVSMTGNSPPEGQPIADDRQFSLAA